MKYHIHILYKKVAGQAKLYLNNYDSLIQQLTERFKGENDSFEMYGELKILDFKANYAQFGYLHAEVFQKIAQGYRDAGWQGFDWEDAKREMKKLFFSKQITNELTGEIILSPRSLADADKDEMTSFIQSCIQLGSEYLNVKIESPEEYKERKNKKQ